MWGHDGDGRAGLAAGGHRRGRSLLFDIFRLLGRLVDALLELLADLEERQALGLHADGVTGARVAPLVGLVVPDFEAAKPADLDALALA